MVALYNCELLNSSTVIFKVEKVNEVTTEKRVLHRSFAPEGVMHICV